LLPDFVCGVIVGPISHVYVSTLLLLLIAGN